MKKSSKRIIIFSALFSGAVLGGCAPSSVSNFGGSFFSSQPSKEKKIAKKVVKEKLVFIYKGKTFENFTNSKELWKAIVEAIKREILAESLGTSKPQETSTEPFKLTLRWKRYVGQLTYIDTNQPLIYKGKILIATNGDKDGKDPYDKLYVFDKDGNLSWSFSSPDGGDTDLSGVVACDEYILTTSDEGYVYALSWNGKILWKTKLGKWPLAFSLYDFTGDGTPDVVVGTWSDNTLYLLNGKTGKII